MSDQWIVQSEARHAADFARLRLLAGLEIAEGVNCFWLRTPTDDETWEQLLSTVNGRRFRLVEGDKLVPWGKRVATERLPKLDWWPLADWVRATLPVAALPGLPTSRIRLSLVRCRAERPAAALLTDAGCWLRYATEAPEVRLRPLVFAMATGDAPNLPQRVFILGTPLPPLPGQPYTVDGGVAVACGWSISPAVGSAVIRKMLSLKADDTALFRIDGSLERIAAEHLVRASRSAVRASVREVTNV